MSYVGADAGSSEVWHVPQNETLSQNKRKTL